MSGGSMDYLASSVRHATFTESTPERRAFRKLLLRVADALHAIEWHDSGDTDGKDESELIRACLPADAVLLAAIEHAEEVRRELSSEIRRARGGGF